MMGLQTCWRQKVNQAVYRSYTHGNDKTMDELLSASRARILIDFFSTCRFYLYVKDVKLCCLLLLGERSGNTNNLSVEVEARR